jgi:hypothetical protein
MFAKNRNQNRIRLLWLCFCAWTAGIVTVPQSQAYILPPEQLVEFMGANFNSFNTLVINQITQQQNPADPANEEDRVFREKLVMQAVGNYRLEILEQTADKLEGADHLFRQLLMNNPKDKLWQLLSRFGIDQKQVFYSRLDGVIVYHLGAKDQNKPKLLIEKKRFLPLLLVYPFPGDPQAKLVRVRFKDYRAVKDKWYPYDITYTVENQLGERYLIQGLESNVALDAALFKTPKTGATTPAPTPAKKISPEEKERLKKIIEAFEKKYE